ncbi:MAG: hypothetical protein KF683_01390 [Rubrivivax sp.]|nr:hypothetical protein [Rubrivivax sp.]
MANALLAWDNRAHGADLVIHADGWWTYTATINNLKLASLAQRFVSTSAAATSTRFTCGFAGNPTIGLIALCTHNLTLSATVRVRASNVGDFSSTVYDSGTLPAFPAGVTEASRAGMRWNWIHRLTTPTAATFWRIEPIDTGNPAGYVSVGRLFAGRGVWQPSVNMTAGAGLGWEANHNIQRSIGGEEWFEEVEGHRVARFDLGPIDEGEALTNAFDLQRVAAGERREVIFVWDPSDGVHAVRRSLLGRLRQLSPIEAPYAAASRTAFEIKELL